MRRAALLLCLCLSQPAFAQEPTRRELEMELKAVQSRIQTERARYEEAKAKMERSELVGRYLLGELEARERELVKKLAEGK